MCGYLQLKKIDDDLMECPMCYSTSPATITRPNANERVYKSELEFESFKESVMTLKTSSSLGTGIVLARQGYILTNAHVLNGESSCDVLFNGKSSVYKAEVLLNGEEEGLDLALLKVNCDFSLKPLSAVSKEFQVGQDIYTMGNPKGIGLSVSKGTVSQITPDFIQLDIVVNPGNSGGPVWNAKGEFIGIISFKYEHIDGIAFAISKAIIDDFIKQYKKEL
jgi:S1-C subfamily serine protease